MRLVPFSDPKQLYPVTPLVAFLRERPGPHRVAGEGLAFFPNVGIFAAQEDVRTHDPVERREYVAWLNLVCGYDPAAYYKPIRDPNAPALDALGVRYLVAGPGAAAPGEKWTPVYSGSGRRDLRERARATPRLRGRRLVGGGVGPRGDLQLRLVPGPGAAAGRARREPRRRRRLEGEGRDRAKVALGRASGPFLKILAPEGDHRIRLDYASPGFRTGALVSLVTAAAAAVLLTVRSRRSAAGRAA